MNNIVWTDLETTGVGPEAQIIEVYMQTEKGESIEFVAAPTLHVSQWDEVALKMHMSSGLYDLCQGGVPQTQISSLVRTWLVKQFNGKPAVLAGASVHNDREWLVRYIGTDLLSHRVYDTSTVRAFVAKFGVRIETEGLPHRAKADTLAAYELDQRCKQALEQALFLTEV